MSEQRLPKGWTEDRLRVVAAFYEGQSEAEAVDEVEAAFDDGDTVFVGVPARMVEKVEALVALETS